MRTVPVVMHYSKKGQEPLKCTHILRVQDWAVAYVEYIDQKVFNLPQHLAMLDRGWTLDSYEYDPNI